MKGMLALLGVVLLAPVSLAQEDEPAADPLRDPSLLDSLPEPADALYRYYKPRLSQCFGDGTPLAEPVRLTVGERHLRFSGPVLALDDTDPELVLGVMGAVKDFSPETEKALQFFLKGFAEAGADVIVLAGDIAGSEYEQAQVLQFVARSGVPVLCLIGNSESRSAFNRAVLAASKVVHNLVNFDLTRRVEWDRATLISLPGYHDRRFVHQSAGCAYPPAEIQGLRRIMDPPKGTMVLVGHGPPRGKGAHALDLAVEAGHVGDPALLKFMTDHDVRIGIFSHILEAGGRAVDAAGAAVSAGVWVERLWLNAGSANPLPWQLNGGRTVCGQAAVVRIKDGRASYRMLENPCAKK
jgi:Icc-related predicted phosphoesterase